MNYLDYINNPPIIKAFFGDKMPRVNPENERSVKKFQDWAVENGYMKQEDLVGKGYGTFGPRTTEAYRKASANSKKPSSTQTAPRPQTTPVESGVYYVNYPDYDVTINESTGNTAKLGHAGVLTVDENGQKKYYEYGRYGSGIGVDKKGNWRSHTVPSAYGTDMDSVSEYLLSVNPKASKARLTRVPDADVKATTEFILNDANDPNRKAYSWGKFWDPKTCGSEAHAAVQAGYKEGVRPLERATRNVAGFAQEYLNPFKIAQNVVGKLSGEGKRLGPGTLDATPQEFEDNWTNRGYKTYKYDKNN